MPTAFVQVDAFTNQPFTGNPAAVFMLTNARDPAWMQAVASEMAVSETAFVVPSGRGFDLRWFTPTHEEELCGHATLASAHVLWESELLAADVEAKFYTCAGVLVARRHDDGLIELDMPTQTPSATTPPATLLAGLTVPPRFVTRNHLDYLIEVDDERTVRQLTPRLDLWTPLDARGVIVTSRSDIERFDFVSRYFALRELVAEDPVTGSAHCALAPYWAERLGKNDMTGHQASARGGVVRVILRNERTSLFGHALTVLRGEALY